MVLKLLFLLGVLFVPARCQNNKISALEMFKREFPDLIFDLENEKNGSLYESVSKFLNQRQAVKYGGGGDGHIKQEMFTMMDTILAMMKWQGFIDDQPHPVWSLIDYGFDLLSDYVKRKSHSTSHDEECPYSYDTMGDLCLSTDLNAKDLTWNEARLYCQLMKGGDLAIFRDANQFHDILKYARKSDTKFEYSFWMGASSEQHPDFFNFINGEYVPVGTPFWGRENFEPNSQNPNSKDLAHFSFLDNLDFHYLSNTVVGGRADTWFVPMCQYFPGRGHNSHHGYHAEGGYYHQGVDNSIAQKLPSILGLSSSGKHKL